MSEYQATYDAMLEALRDPDFRQVFYDAVRDALKDQRIAELEAEVARLKAQSRALTTVLEGEREKLRAVGELPGKWRDKTNLTGDTLGCKYGITAEECADELEALLKEEGK